jgi:protein SDA1
LLYDPQQFAEQLFSMLKRSGEAFSVRQLMMNVISRLIGGHKLLVLDFYPFLQKYIQAHQRDVTSILVYLAQV